MSDLEGAQSYLVRHGLHQTWTNEYVRIKDDQPGAAPVQSVLLVLQHPDIIQGSSDVLNSDLNTKQCC